MAFSPQTFSFEEVLTSTKLNQTDTNIDEVRTLHKGNSAPASPAAGVLWLDDSTSQWTLKIYDGADWIALLRVEPSSNFGGLSDPGYVFSTSGRADLYLERFDGALSASDFISALFFKGQNSTGTRTDMGMIRGQVLDPSAGAEDTRVDILPLIGGVFSRQIGAADGVIVGNPTGGFQGGGTINVQGAIYIGGTTAWVDQGYIKTTTGTVNVAGPTGTEGSFTLPGGSWGFYPQVRTTDSGDDLAARIAGNFGFTSGPSNTSFATLIQLGVPAASGSGTTHAQQRYITSSPPYDLGDGPMHGFVYLWQRGTQLLGTYVADTPPWIWNGPTDLTPDVIDGGAFYKRKPKAKALFRQMHEGEITLDEAREMANSPEWQGDELVLIDEAMQHADIGVIPHPFASAQPGDRILLLDPMDPIVGMLIEAMNAGEDIADLHRGRIRPGGLIEGRMGPPGVIQVKITG